MGRNPCCSKEGLNRGAWTALEDQILIDYVKTHGEGKWRNIPKQAGLKRCGKSCRLRWLNYLRPDIKRGNISNDEEDLIIRLHKLLGNRWSLIAGRLPGRTDNEIKNYWNTSLSKKAQGKQSNQPKNESKQPIRQPGTDDRSLKSGMVRANSSRCTKALVNDPQQDQLLADQYNDTINMAAAEAAAASNGPSMDSLNPVMMIKKETAADGPSMDSPNPVMMIKKETAAGHDQLSESSDDGSSILFTCDDKILSVDFELDFDMGEILLSEYLDPEISKLSDFNFHDFNNVIEEGHNGTNNGCCYQTDLSPFSDQELLISEEMVENYVQATGGMESEFQFFASCFEPAAADHEWVEDR